MIYAKINTAEYFYIIKKGWVKLFNETLDSTEAVMDILTAGHILGYESIFNGGKYSNYPQTVEDAELLLIPNHILKSQIDNNNKFALSMIKHLSYNKGLKEKEIEHLTSQNAPQRIGCFLLRLCPENQKSNFTLQLPYDKLLLASRLAMKPETFSRALKILRKKTNIKISGSQIKI